MYRLAVAVGDPIPEQPGGLADRIEFWQLMQWARFGEIEPWDMRRADLHAGIVASTIANANRTKGQRPFKPGDFMPDFEPKPPQTPQQMKSIFAAFAKAHNEAVRRAGQ